MSDETNNEAGVTQLETASAPAEKKHDHLGVRTTRILLISSHVKDDNTAAREAAGVESMPRLRGWLENADHTVSQSDPSQWQAALNAVQPEIVLVEAGHTDQAASAETCRAVKRISPRRLVLAVLPADTAADSWPQWKDAGADDYVTTAVTSPELNARITLMSRLAAAMRELDLARERLSRHTQVDETTQLLNRRSFFQNAHRECSRARRYNHPLACLMVDIDYLDEMGKTFGYGCVEYVLRAVAYTVRQWTRDSDIAGRFSERKFVVLLPETDIEGATAVREKILTALDETRFEWDNQQLPISVSIGESERFRDPSLMPGAAKEIQDGDDENGDGSSDGAEPLSVREELASILEDADAALNVARRSSIRPGIFVQYTPGSEEEEAAS